MEPFYNLPTHIIMPVQNTLMVESGHSPIAKLKLIEQAKDTRGNTL